MEKIRVEEVTRIISDRVRILIRQRSRRNQEALLPQLAVDVPSLYRKRYGWGTCRVFIRCRGVVLNLKKITLMLVLGSASTIQEGDSGKKT